MKKHTYLNQSQKILLATMTIPLVVSVLPIENVSANQIPTLNVYEVNGIPKLEWATEILQENIIMSTGFENQSNELLLNLNPANSTNINTLITNEESYSSSNSLKILANNNGSGNGTWHGSPIAYYSNIGILEHKLMFEEGTKLSISLKAKSKGQGVINGHLQGTSVNYPNISNIKLKEDISQGQNYFYVEDVNEIKKIEDFPYIVTKKSNIEGGYVFSRIENYNEETGYVKIVDVFENEYKKGDYLYLHENYQNPFNERIVNNNDWELYNFNTIISPNNYSLTRGLNFFMTFETDNDLYIDDLKFGYATEVEVYRDNESVYKGYLSDFYDTSVKDTVKPNKVTQINGSLTNDFNIKLGINKPTDNGTKVNYQIQSIAKNGTRSPLSTPQKIEIKTDVVKYKYSIGNESFNTTSIETQSLNDITIPLKSINLETDYLHIQAVDANGNASDVSSFKLHEFIDMSELYDKIKELEDSDNYNDFIDFIDEIEKLYGDNLPEDIIDRLNELAKHHGTNTSFLLLEEGDFRLSTSDIESFGKIKLTAKKQTLTTAFKDDFSVIDARGTQEGWHVSVSATPFTVETFDGFVGSPHQLPIGSLALNAVNGVEQVGQVHNSQLPAITLNQLTAIDGQNATIKLLNAEKQKGMGEFKFSFTPDALALTVDAVTAKIDTVNYPTSNTPYASTVTWDLVSGPQI